MRKVLDKGYVRLVETMGSDLTIVNAARVSYDKQSNELNDKDRGLIKFLIREGHTSPLRHAMLTFEIYAPLMVCRQHWKYVAGSSFQEATGDNMTAWNESCLPLDGELKAWSGRTYTIERLLDLKAKGKLPAIRSVNREGEIVKGKLLDVFKSGHRDVFEVESDLGFKVRTTDNHRFLTPDGYKELKDLQPGDEVMMNGEAAYRNKDWLEKEYVTEGRTQKEIAERAGCSEHTIRKWVRIHRLQQNQLKRLQRFNEKHGVFGKGLTNETSDIIAERSRKMSKNSKGVPRPREFSKPTKDNTGHWQARQKFEKTECKFCSEKETLEIHHIDRNPKNNEESNVEVLCVPHHNMRHGRKPLLVAHPVKIKAINKVSTEDVYDVEVEKYHNFVSNQFILHNSRRYISEDEQFYIPQADEWRSKPENSKQGSGENLNTNFGEMLTYNLNKYLDQGEQLYKIALDVGAAPEQARLFLPAYGMYVRYYWTASLQSVLHFLDQRLASDSQKEIQLYAQAVEEYVTTEFPEVYNAWRGQLP